MSDREQFLGRVRDALRGVAQPDLPGRPSAESASERSALAEAFTRAASAAGAEVHRPAHDETLPLVVRLARQAGGENCLAWDEPDLPWPGLRPVLESAGFRMADPYLPAEPALRGARLQALDAPRLGVTGALGGLADTGSLALPGGPGRPRSASLLPYTHLALLPESRLYPDMASFLSAQPHLAHTTSSLVFITGPSRTADIEMILTRGVHGPRHLHIVLLPAAP